jgi:hypothetical protein
MTGRGPARRPYSRRYTVAPPDEQRCRWVVANNGLARCMRKRVIGYRYCGQHNKVAARSGLFEIAE